MLEREEVWKDDEHMAMLGSRIMDPSMGAGPRFLAAKKGALRCRVVTVTSRRSSPSTFVGIRRSDWSRCLGRHGSGVSGGRCGS